MTTIELAIDVQNHLIQFAKEFAVKMNEIELKIVELDKNNVDGKIDCFAQYRKRYNPVFQQYTTIRKRVYGGQANSYGTPPKYDGIELKNAAQLNIKTKSKVEVYFKTDNLNKTEYLFILFKKKDGWKIDNVKFT